MTRPSRRLLASFVVALSLSSGGSTLSALADTNGARANTTNSAVGAAAGAALSTAASALSDAGGTANRPAQKHLALPATQYPLTKADIRFGERQVKRMLSDRPQMRRLIKKRDELWIWTARQYAGEFTGRRYNWQKNPDTSGSGVDQFGAWHNFDLEKNSGYVTVKKTREDGLLATPEQMWAGVIYELFNVRNDSDFQEAWNDVLAHKLSKADYTACSTRLEYNALKELSRFYCSNWKAQAQKFDYESSSWYWFPDLPDTYEAWVSKYKTTNPGYFNYYEKGYDTAFLQTKVQGASNSTERRLEKEDSFGTGNSRDFAMPDRKPLTDEHLERAPRN